MKTNKLKQQKGTLLRVLQYVKPYRVLVIVSLLCACVSAAAQLGVSQSALSHAMRKLEARLDVRLLTRTTRSVVPTQAGEQLFTRLSPHLLEIEQELTALRSSRDKPAGAIRIVAGEHAMDAVLWPILTYVLLLPQHQPIEHDANRPI